jgi:hypothetical protein
MSWKCMDAISLTRCCFASRANLPNTANQAVNGEPVAFNGARRVRGGGWGNTPVERLEGAPCPYSTRGGWGNTPVERLEGAPCPYSTRGPGASNGPWLPDADAPRCSAPALTERRTGVLGLACGSLRVASG